MKLLLTMFTVFLGFTLSHELLACGGCNKSSASSTNKKPQTITTTSTVSTGTPSAERRGSLPIIRGAASLQNTTNSFSSGFFSSVGNPTLPDDGQRGVRRGRARGLREGGNSLRKPR